MTVYVVQRLTHPSISEHSFSHDFHIISIWTTKDAADADVESQVARTPYLSTDYRVEEWRLLS